MRKYFVLIVLILSLIIVFGCRTNRLEGTWANNEHQKCIFRSNGSVVFDVDGEKHEGTYKIKEGAMTINLMGNEEDVNLTDNPDEIKIYGYIFKKEIQK